MRACAFVCVCSPQTHCDNVKCDVATTTTQMGTRITILFVDASQYGIICAYSRALSHICLLIMHTKRKQTWHTHTGTGRFHRNQPTRTHAHTRALCLQWSNIPQCRGVWDFRGTLRSDTLAMSHTHQRGSSGSATMSWGRTIAKLDWNPNTRTRWRNQNGLKRVILQSVYKTEIVTCHYGCQYKTNA